MKKRNLIKDGITITGLDAAGWEEVRNTLRQDALATMKKIQETKIPEEKTYFQWKVRMLTRATAQIGKAVPEIL